MIVWTLERKYPSSFQFGKSILGHSNKCFIAKKCIKINGWGFWRLIKVYPIETDTICIIKNRVNQNFSNNWILKFAYVKLKIESDFISGTATLNYRFWTIEWYVRGKHCALDCSVSLFTKSRNNGGEYFQLQIFNK